MSYAAEFTQGAEDDLARLYGFSLDRAETLEGLDVAVAAVKVSIRALPPLESQAGEKKAQLEGWAEFRWSIGSWDSTDGDLLCPSSLKPS